VSLLRRVIDEAEQSGIKEVVLVISPSHKKHFDAFVKRFGRHHRLRFSFCFQEKLLGTGHSLVVAADLIGNQPFAVRYCDDVLVSNKPALLSMMELFESYQSSIIMLQKVLRAQTKNYGVVSVKKQVSSRLYKVTDIVEKPEPGKEPSSFAVVGAYIFTPSVVKNLKELFRITPIFGDSLPFMAGLLSDIADGKDVYGWEFPGTRFDCGTLEGLTIANRKIKPGHQGLE
jgi:UTP--glucose-1-phosphate uridylyltransferase